MTPTICAFHLGFGLGNQRRGKVGGGGADVAGSRRESNVARVASISAGPVLAKADLPEHIDAGILASTGAIRLARGGMWVMAPVLLVLLARWHVAPGSINHRSLGPVNGLASVL